MLKVSILYSFVLCFLCWSLTSFATEKILLDVTSSSQLVEKQYTLAQLQRFPQHEIKALLPWVGHSHIYKGPYLKDIFADANIVGKMLTLKGLDNYKISFDYQEIKEFNPILALQADGKLLSVRSKGPIVLILPIDDNPALNEEVYHDYMVWQLVEINVEEE